MPSASEASHKFANLATARYRRSFDPGGRSGGRVGGQAPCLVWQPVHFRGGASLYCAQHHFPAYTTPVHGNGRQRAGSASASAITTPTHRSHIHRMAVPPRVNPAKRTYQCCAGHCCAGPKRHAYIYIHLDCFSALFPSGVLIRLALVTPQRSLARHLRLKLRALC